jgi:membrane-associated phospholipid phosphatase
LSWRSVAEARAAWDGFQRGWVELPPAARRGWWVALGEGLVVAQALAIALVLAVRRLDARGGLAVEEAWVRRIGEIEALSFNSAIWLDVFGNGFLLTPLIAVTAAVAAHRRAPLLAVALVLGYASLFIPLFSCWLLWPRERPTFIADGIGSPGAALSSFPSGHLLQAVVAYGALWYLWCRSTGRWAERVTATILLVGVVTVVALARLRLGSHWPTDIAAALVLGAAWLALLVRALRRGERLAVAGPVSAAARG